MDSLQLPHPDVCIPSLPLGTLTINLEVDLGGAGSDRLNALPTDGFTSVIFLVSFHVSLTAWTCTNSSRFADTRRVARTS